MITVLLADDHELFLKSLRSLLEQAEDVQVIATASNGEEAIAQAVFYLPDVAIMDLAMPLLDGIAVTRQICQSCPNTRVLILTISSSSEYVERAVQAGASGYLVKDKTGENLLAAIRALSRGNQVFGDKVEGPIRYHSLDNESNAWDGYIEANYLSTDQ
jgi:DNA-binding NarL/FixJ family response regulator